MSSTSAHATDVEFLRELRQQRRFTDRAVPDDALAAILRVARWSGSSKNSQPWDFLVVRDPERLATISALGAYTGFFKGAPLVIVLVMHGASTRSEAYDEGRVSERIMLAAKAQGLGSGTGWWSDAEAQAAVKQELGIPPELHLHSGIAIGYPEGSATPSTSVNAGRKPLAELVHYESYDSHTPQT